MQIPIQVTFRSFGPSKAIAALVREEADKLERFHGRIISCRVVIEAPHRHKQTGRIFHVNISLKVPGREIVVSREPEVSAEHEDMRVAIHDAFNVAGRQLEDYMRKRRGDVKSLALRPQGRVLRVITDQPGGGFGFLESSDGREIYFHSNSLLNVEFEELKPGELLRYSEESGESGPQASTVELL